MAITNKIRVFFNLDAIGEKFDFFKLTTSEKYIPRGAYLLDKPQTALKALSVAFDYGRSAFVMFPKGAMGKGELISQIGDERISISSLHPSEIKEYILVRLFLYALGNYVSDEYQFNNLTGKLYLNQPEFAAKNGKSIMALGIDVDQNLCMSIEATTFTLLSVFKGKSAKKLAGSDYPKYILGSNGKLRRCLQADAGDKVYIRKGMPGRKAEYPFLSLRPEEARNTKSYYLYSTISQLRKRFGELLQIELCSLRKTAGVGTRLDSGFVERSIAKLSPVPVVAVDKVEDDLYREDFKRLVESISKRLGKPIEIAGDIVPGAANIVFIHSKDYYEEITDPYAALPREEVIQCVTVEDTMNKIIKDSAAVINTIIKEIAIKTDLVAGSISLDDWSAFGFEGNWYFGTEIDRNRYFMEVRKDGTFAFHLPQSFGGFKDEIVSGLNEEMDGYDSKGKTIIANDKGDICLISRTNLFCLPSQEVFSLSEISRSKQSRDALLEGVVDINLFEENGKTYYSSGMIGAGMNTGMPHASILYSVETIKGKSIIADLLATMSVMFVKYNGFTVLPYPVKYLREYIKTIQ